MISFGSRLQELRNMRKMTQEELGNHFEMSKSAIGMYERGEREPSLELVVKFAEFFNVPVDYMLGGDNTDVSSIDPEVLALLSGNKKEQQRFKEYLRGERDTMFNDTEKEFLEDAKTLTAEDLLNRYSLKIGDRFATKEEVEEMLMYLRFKWFNGK